MVISLKLAVDKQKNRVVYAECDSNFVDILYGFLTLPLGTIVRLLDKKSGIGFLDNLYKSIDNLATEHFQTNSCKSMLLQPRSSAEQQCEDLAINIDDLDPRRLFRCPGWRCCDDMQRYYSSVKGVECPCGRIMDQNNLKWTKSENGSGNGVFLKCPARFIVSDDLHVQVLSSVGPSISFLQRLGITDISKLKMIGIQINKSQVLNLLKRSFHSKTPMTDTFLTPSLTNICLKYWRNMYADKTKIFSTNVDTKCEGKLSMKEKHHNSNEGNVIKVKILGSKLSDKAILESENDFVDLIFSFLTFPLGAALSLLGKKFSSVTLGCYHNLYNSIGDLKDDKQSMLSAANKDMLLNPKLPPYFGCSNQLLMVKEKQSSTIPAIRCGICFYERRSSCRHDLGEVALIELNPKISRACTEYGGGFARSSSRFLICSDMKVEPMSTISMIPLMKYLGLSSPHHIREKEFTIGEAEALDLLGAFLATTADGNKSFLNYFNLE